MSNRKEAIRLTWMEENGFKKMGVRVREDFERWYKEGGQTIDGNFLSSVNVREAELDEEENRLAWMAAHGIKKMGCLVREQYEAENPPKLRGLPNFTGMLKNGPPDLSTRGVEEIRGRIVSMPDRETVEEAEEADRKASEPVTPMAVRAPRAPRADKAIDLPFGIDDSAKQIMEEVRGKKLTWINKLASAKELKYEEDTVPPHPTQLSLTEHYDGRRTLNFAGLSGFRSLELKQLVEVK
jgi:hypothetical protein